MKATVKKLPKSQVEITITVPYNDYMQAEKAAVEQLGKEIKVDGFRPGSVPENVVREKAGQEAIHSATLEKIIPMSYSAAVKENQVAVISQPSIEIKSPALKEGDDFVYVVTVSVMPEVKIGDYKKIKIKRKKVEVTPKDVEATIDMLMNRFAEWKDVDREAKEGDRVELEFEGFDEKGEAIPNTASKNHPVILGSKTMVPGFEEAVIGMKKTTEKSFDIAFPKDYHAKPMQGKKVTFKVKLTRLEEKGDQTLNEALVEKITGQKGSVEDFKKRVEQDLLMEMKQRAQGDLDNQVVQAIVKITEVDLPESLIAEEIKLMKDERKQQVARQGITWEQYLTHIKKTDEDFTKDHLKPAEERLTARLGVNQIIQAEKIEITDEEVEQKVQEIIAQYPPEAKEKVIEYYKKDSEGYRQLKNNLSADKLINMFIEG